MKTNILIGKIGEDKACEHLVENGYKILNRNYRKPWGEIDVITVAQDKTLVFVEVKTLKVSDVLRQTSEFSLTPEDNLSHSKLKKLQRTCQMFVAKHPELIDEKVGWRIDLLALTISEKDCIIRTYENI